jgi:two-component system NtrC family sensor kinase
MRVTAKLVVAFLAGMFIVTSISTWLEIQRESREFHRLLDEESRLMGQFFEPTVAAMWDAEGVEGVLGLLNRIQPRQHEVRVSWVWFDAPSGPYRPLVAFEDVHNVAFEEVAPVIVKSVEHRFICDYWPIDVSGPRAGGLQFIKPLTALSEVKRDVIEETIAFVSTMLLVSGLVVAVVGARFVGRPLKRLIDNTHKIAAGDLDSRVQLKSNDELSQLADSFNAMCDELSASRARLEQETADRLAATEQLRHDDRLKTVGRLASGVAHELGTPLNVVSGRAQLIAGGKLPQDEVLTSAKTIQHEANRMTTIIRNLLDFARRRTPQRSPVDVRNVVDQTTKLLGSLASKNDVSICVSSDASPCVASIDAGQIEQVLSNLILNAIQAMPDGGLVEVDVNRRRSTRNNGHDETPPQYVCVDVRDQGVGISSDDLPHVFEPFYSTKSIGKGTGLGLSISYGIIQEHGGFIDVQSRPREGSCFSVFLPIGDTS